MAEPETAAPIEIDPVDWQELLAILGATVPDRDVWAFGSRTTGRAKRYSDLDLALDGPHPLSLDARAQLVEALQSSGLPFLVDLVDLLTVDPDFGTGVRRAGVLIQKAHVYPPNGG